MTATKYKFDPVRWARGMQGRYRLPDGRDPFSLTVQDLIDKQATIDRLEREVAHLLDEQGA